MSKVSQVRSDTEQYSYRLETPKKRLDLNNLLIRAKEEEKKSRKINLLVFSGATTVVLVILYGLM